MGKLHDKWHVDKFIIGGEAVSVEFVLIKCIAVIPVIMS